MRSALFDDHSEAYIVWSLAGFRGLSCLHVDAHLDLMEEGFSSPILEAMGEASNYEQVQLFREADGPHGAQLHCANYLFPALAGDLLAELVWVVPDAMFDPNQALACAVDLVSHWIDIPIDDLRTWKADGSSVSGTLFGKPFAVCDRHGLALLRDFPRGPLALDIDVDYFIRVEDDVVWSTPYELARHIPWKPEVLTVALSTTGGYTPPHDVFLGEACLKAFAGGSDEQDWCRRVSASEAEQWAALLEQAPANYRPALLARMGRWAEAEAEDSRYVRRNADMACRHLEKGEWEQGLAFLRTHPDISVSVELEFYCLFQLCRWDEVLAHYRRYPERLQKRGPEGLKIRHLLAQTHARLGEWGAACDSLREALKTAPEHHGLWFELARCQWKMDQPKKAARSLIKALRYARARSGYGELLRASVRMLEQMDEPHLLKSCRRDLDLWGVSDS